MKTHRICKLWCSVRSSLSSSSTVLNTRIGHAIYPPFLPITGVVVDQSMVWCWSRLSLVCHVCVSLERCLNLLPFSNNHHTFSGCVSNRLTSVFLLRYSKQIFYSCSRQLRNLSLFHFPCSAFSWPLCQCTCKILPHKGFSAFFCFLDCNCVGKRCCKKLDTSHIRDFWTKDCCSLGWQTFFKLIN